MMSLINITSSVLLFGTIRSNVNNVMHSWDIALHVSSDLSSERIRAELWNLFHAWTDPLGLCDPSVIIGAGWVLEEIL